MTKKTRAQKIAARMRQNTSPQSVVENKVAPRNIASSPTQPAIEHISLRDDKASGFVRQDLRRSLTLTLLITSLMTLITVLQYKGYF